MRHRLANDNKAAKSTSETRPAGMEEALELAKRAFALRKYEQAVDHYATALEFLYA